MIGILLPIQFPSRILSNVIKTMIYSTSLVICGFVVNLRYQSTGFKYSQDSILNNVQANQLIGCILISGLSSVMGQFVSIWDKWGQCFINVINLGLILTTISQWSVVPRSDLAPSSAIPRSVEWQCGPSVCGPSLCHPSLCDPSLCEASWPV